MDQGSGHFLTAEQREQLRKVLRVRKAAGLKVRRLLVILLGGAWIAWWGGVGYAPPDDIAPLLVGTLVYLLLGIGLVLGGRSEMLEFRHNRDMAWIFFPMLVVQLLWLGTAMMKGVMRSKRVESLPELMRMAQENGVRMIACQMSMDMMGIQPEELIEGVEIGGVATYINETDKANASLFI